MYACVYAYAYIQMCMCNRECIIYSYKLTVRNNTFYNGSEINILTDEPVFIKYMGQETLAIYYLQDIYVGQV